MNRSAVLCPLVGILLWVATGGAAEPLIARGAAGWRYLDLPLEHPEKWQSQAWQAAEYDDREWAEGQAILGYGDQDVVTHLASDRTATPRQQSAVFFRRRFTVGQRTRFRALRGCVVCDDGAVVYVNGREVYRHNMPNGEISHMTRAVHAVGPETSEERALHEFEVSMEVVRDGDNTVAVSVHQANGTSRDLAFDLDLAGMSSDEEVAEFRRQLQVRAAGITETTKASLQFGPVADEPAGS